MNLPKYIPGLTVIVREEPKNNDEPILYPEGIGMFVIANAFIDHEEWHYQDYDGKTQVHESEIVGVINNGYFVASERFNGVVEAPEQNPDIQKEVEQYLEEDAEEKAFITEQLEKHLKTKKSKKIEVKDGNSEIDS